jgi:hypothetical protein
VKSEEDRLLIVRGEISNAEVPRCNHLASSVPNCAAAGLCTRKSIKNYSFSFLDDLITFTELPLLISTFYVSG